MILLIVLLFRESTTRDEEDEAGRIVAGPGMVVKAKC